eukprot:577926-Pelagomonas_calceolata.AAC.7
MLAKTVLSRRAVIQGLQGLPFLSIEQTKSLSTGYKRKEYTVSLSKTCTVSARLHTDTPC